MQARANSGYRYKIGDRVVVFTKKGDGVHGTVKWVGVYSYTVSRKDCSVKSVGVETDVRLKASEVDGLPIKGQPFVPAKDKGAVFLSEDEVLSEADFSVGTPPHLHCKASAAGPGPLTSSSQKVAYAVSATASSAGSIHQFSEEKKRESQQGNGGGLSRPRQVEHIYDAPQFPHSSPAGQAQPPPQHYSHQPQPPVSQPNQFYVNHNFPLPLDVGSPVELVGDPSRHGVVKWLGPLPEARGLIAGVELDGPMDGCGDGERGGHRYFTCLPGRGYFCPVTSLRPDPRLSQATPPALYGGSSVVNPLAAVPVWEEFDQTIQGDQISKYIGNRRGIQGHQNSSYLDATIFGLFALSDVFDYIFLNHLSLQSPTPATPATGVQEEIGAMLWKGIVNPLRKHGVVKFESVMKLRNKLEELGKMEGVNTAEKDPEEFLKMLFKHTFYVEPFMHIKRPFGTEPEFFVQLFVEFDQSIRVPTIENLLMKMFREQQISFSEVPSKLLVQVPRYGKQFQTYKRIIPRIKFDTTPLLDSQNRCFFCNEPAQLNCTECGTVFSLTHSHICDRCSSKVHKHPARVNHKPERCGVVEGVVELSLLSVLCIETSHYVCFSRDSEGRWLFFDSMADRIYDQFNIPRGVDCTAQLNQWVYEGDQERLMAAGPRELPELVRRFTQDVYMCVYIQPDYGMYG